MKIKVSDYIAQFVVENGITDAFTVVGGGAIHLNDAFGHKDGLHCTYNHHEQACAIAAEAYARLENKPALVCVTSGPGGINALTGVCGGWLDSIPMFIVSGQVKYTTTARYAKKLNPEVELRSLGDQEYDIVKSAEPMTKYAVMLEDAKDVRYACEKAFHLATTGRPGPVWIDVPVDIQGTVIETDELEGYDPANDDSLLPPAIDDETVNDVLNQIKNAKRPVIYAGGGIRLSSGYEEFKKAVKKLNVPVVTYWNSVDLIENENPLYIGRGGNMGDRAGNFAVQNSDLVLAIGTRISIRQVGYNYETWAREAKVIMVDIDKSEMKKHTVHIDKAIWADAKDFLCAVNRCADDRVFSNEEWLGACRNWKNKYPVTLPRHWNNGGEYANVFAFVKYLSDSLPEESYTAVSNGACCVVGHQNYTIKKNTRFIINSAIASMGYGLPASIGLCVADGKKDTVCLEGDGSIMMNLQELQTIVTNKLPIKIFLINNQGYHSIRLTQNNIFSEHCKVGIGPESGDLSFPDFELIAKAFGYPYYSAHNNDEMKTAVEKTLNQSGFAFCEIFTDTEQIWEPKSSARKLEDGTIVSPPLEDLAPFLPRKELLENLFIKPLE
ncbi:MAG: thiamine pyrophosphate-binding protein [Clostridiales bacterium]|nr:thiamine pyrophosphate-binding protein [Clostridiales bacterium]